ncbi:MAG: hypothetical protein AAF990_17270 [Bacteroidota bacterium]
MKKLFYSCLFLISSFPLLSQVNIEEQKVEYEGNLRPACSVVLEPESKEVKKRFKDYMNQKHDVRIKGIGFLTNKDVLNAEEVQLKTISPKTIDFYAQVVEKDGKTQMSLFADYGYDIFVSPQEDASAFENMRLLLIDFLNDYLPGYYSQQVEAARDVLNNLKEERSEMKEDIAENSEEIDEKLSEIKDLRKENQDLSNALNEQIKLLDEKEAELQQTKTALQRVSDQLQSMSKEK